MPLTGILIYETGFVPVVVLGLLLVCKVRSCRDHLYIRDELKLQSLLITMIILIDLVFHVDQVNGASVRNVTILYAALSVAIALESHVWTLWIIGKYNQRVAITAASPLHPDYAPTL